MFNVITSSNCCSSDHATKYIQFIAIVLYWLHCVYSLNACGFHVYKHPWTPQIGCARMHCNLLLPHPPYDLAYENCGYYSSMTTQYCKFTWIKNHLTISRALLIIRVYIPSFSWESSQEALLPLEDLVYFSQQVSLLSAENQSGLTNNSPMYTYPCTLKYRIGSNNSCFKK